VSKTTHVSVPLTLDLNTETFNKLTPAQRTQLPQMAAQFLESYLNGGIVVRPDIVQKMEEASNKQIDTDVQLLQVVQHAQKRDEGMNVITCKIDPALMPAVEEYAKTVGWELKDVLDDISNRIVRDNLMFYVNSQAHQPVIYLTDKQAEELQKVFKKKHFDGDDFLSLLEEHVTV
jgi:hypothetical protein